MPLWASLSLTARLKPGTTIDLEQIDPGETFGWSKSDAREQTEANLQRTRILSPVDGYVTNLLTQLGNYVNVGVNAISLVDAHSYWVDGYFEETNLAPIGVGNAAQIKLMGHSQILRGHVDSIARAISVSNAQPNNRNRRNRGRRASQVMLGAR